MNSLSPLFLWLLPLALLPVLIHLLNRLRYRTVKWAAMMFLRTADRDASRRAKIRQWIILAARCLMLAAFLLALARLQSKGRLARFFDRGSPLVVVIFDRTASMEQLRGGASGRERALALVQQGLGELTPGARVLWLDSADGSFTPLPRGVELRRLPLADATSGGGDMATLLRVALREITRVGVPSAEIWIPSDRQASAWMPEGTNLPDWKEWAGMNTRVSIRLLDVARVPPDSGNRSLQVTGDVIREGNSLQIPLRLLRDSGEPESVPLAIDTGGLALREDILVEGTSFRWEQTFEILPGQEELSALFSLPADSNNADNEVAVAWRNRGAVRAKVDVSDRILARSVSAGLLPRPEIRERVDAGSPLDENLALWIRDAGQTFSAAEQTWLESGGVVLTLPTEDSLMASGDTPLTLREWNEQTGPLANEQGEPLRLDLLQISRAARLDDTEGIEVLARLVDGSPFLTRRVVGEGAVYELATLPVSGISNLDAGFVWVPMLQRMLQEGLRRETQWGMQRLGDWKAREGEAWVSADEGERDILRHTGRYTLGNRLIALNRMLAEDQTQTLSVEEIQKWAGPMELKVFEDRSERGDADPRRVDLTSILALAGLLFLVIESFLLTRNVRRPSSPRSAWSSAT